MRTPLFELSATDAVTWLQSLPSESVDLVITDPAVPGDCAGGRITRERAFIVPIVRGTLLAPISTSLFISTLLTPPFSDTLATPLGES